MIDIIVWVGAILAFIALIIYLALWGNRLMIAIRNMIIYAVED